MSNPFFSVKTKSSTEDAKPGLTMQMPHVFVIPPEEDETPTWCCFDAENPAHSQIREIAEPPDIIVMDFPCEPESPVLRRMEPGLPESVVMPRRSVESLSVVEAFMKDEVHGDSESDTESEYDEDAQSIHEIIRHESPRAPRDAANDSDVIEVVKVSRRKVPSQDDHLDGQSIEQYSDIKRSATLKSRASKVFKSLKGTLRSSKPRAQDIPPMPTISTSQGSEHPPQESLSRSRTPTVTRRGSRILSQLFTAPSLKSRSSMASMGDPSSPGSPTSTTAPSVQNVVPPKSNSRHPSMNVAEQDAARLRATSPTPTTSSSKSTSRFSKFNIQKMFSFSSHTSPSIPTTTTPIVFDDPGYMTPTRSASCTPPSVVSSPSTSATTSGPQTPTSTEEVTHVHLVGRKDTADFPAFDSFDSAFDVNAGLNLGLGLGVNLDPGSNSDSQQTDPRPSFGSISTMGSWMSVAGKRSSESTQPRRSQGRDLQDEADASLEMRLDSFHFDSISFDADQFTTTH